MPELYFCNDMKGYGWCFRKGLYLKIEPGREDSHVSSTHLEHFRDFLKQCGRIPQNIPGYFHCHAARRRINNGMLYGDAAVKPCGLIKYYFQVFNYIGIYMNEWKAGWLAQRILKLTIGVGMLFVSVGSACASEKYNEARGQLLYTTHCNTCHTTQIHWRQQKLVTDWESLVAQVRRWQYISGLGWSEDEVQDVSQHLDTFFYGYINSVKDKKPAQLMQHDK